MQIMPCSTWLPLQVINWDKFMSIPRESGLSQEARDLIFSLCTRWLFSWLFLLILVELGSILAFLVFSLFLHWRFSSDDRRIGKNGSDDIKSHPFFANIDFSSALRTKQAPYKPTIKWVYFLFFFGDIISQQSLSMWDFYHQADLILCSPGTRRTRATSTQLTRINWGPRTKIGEQKISYFLC